MSKTNLLALTLVALLSGCAENANMQVDRYQFDDIRDADQDGIINQRDLCAETPLHAKVDNEGCTLWTDVENISWFSIDFEFDKSGILTRNFAALDEAVIALQKNPNIKLMLIGDTSSEGTLQYNESLADRRNLAVKYYLVSKGIDKARIETKVFDEKGQYTDQLKQRKRRTIAVLVDQHKSFTEAWHIYTTDPENK